MNTKDALLIIPAYNESKAIGKVIIEIKNQLPDLDILVVNDGSIDNTDTIAKKHGVDVVSLPFNVGYGAALQTGYQYAQDKNYQYILQMDADGQHEPKELVNLVRAIKNDQVDVVIGSRFLNECNYQASWPRRLGMIIFSKITSLIIKQKITDPTSGFQALNHRVLEFFTSEFYPSDYPDADVIVLLYYSGFRIKEIPVVMYSALNKGKIHNGLKPLYYVFKMFLSIIMIFLRKKPYFYRKENKL